MKSVFKYVALFLVTYLVFLIPTIPAAWVMTFITLPKGVEISQVSGTVWHTQAKQVSVNNIVINDIDLNLSPLSLLTLNPVVNVTFGGGLTGSALVEEPKGEATLTNLLNELTVQNLVVKVPAQFVVDQITLPIEAKAHNPLTLTVDNYVAGKPYCQALRGKLEWQRAAATAFNETLEVGALAVNLGCIKGNIEATVVENNDLGLSFSGILARNNRFTGQGYLTPGDKFPERLKALLSFLGKPDNQGRYALKL